jgi:hypothetical protein
MIRPEKEKRKAFVDKVMCFPSDLDGAFREKLCGKSVAFEMEKSGSFRIPYLF